MMMLCIDIPSDEELSLPVFRERRSTKTDRDFHFK